MLSGFKTTVEAAVSIANSQRVSDLLLQCEVESTKPDTGLWWQQSENSRQYEVVAFMPGCLNACILRKLL